MSFIWTAVCGILCFELVLLFLLVLPLPWGVRKNVSRVLLNKKIRNVVDTALRYLGFGLALALVDSVNALSKINARFDATDDGAGAAPASTEGLLGLKDLKLRRAIGQRNLYLGGFALVLILTLSRLVSLVSNEMELREEIKRLNGGRAINEKGTPLEDKRTKSK
jgi:B-cell receptor-associated protein 31